jgi:hypothetical protein
MTSRQRVHDYSEPLEVRWIDAAVALAAASIVVVVIRRFGRASC